MIKNGAGIGGAAWHCHDGLWRIRTIEDTRNNNFGFPIEPDGFDTQSACDSWWAKTGDIQTCRVCGMGFYAARDDGQFCSPKCRAKYNRHQQGASETQFTGAYHQRPDADRTHTRHSDTFEYQCEWCHKWNTARSEAKRSGKRVPQYCNDNGGACRQAAYRDRRKQAKKSNPPPSRDTHQNSHSGPTGDAGRASHQKPADSSEPSHSGAWRGQFDAMAFLSAAYRFNHHGTQAAWAAKNDRKEALAWARRYLASQHPDKTAQPVDTLYKTISDCYSYLRNKPA